MLLEHLRNASHAWNEYLSVTHDALYVCKMLVFVELTDHHCAPSSVRWKLYFRQVFFILIVLIKITFTLRRFILRVLRRLHVSLGSSFPDLILHLFHLHKPISVYLPIFFKILHLHDNSLFHVVGVSQARGGWSGCVLDDAGDV